ncbi:VOC family protein [Sphingomonas fennica]|uniref:Glyoxalase n=1 Tax=Edaphosphingomonas fennica TaxID=114404 RepID=A0A2T4I071_9SPHN|nr:VOC family protein [Sphingomonas fennica]PTD22113.1 glyoxalase [Sphingomonas fennica]
MGVLGIGGLFFRAADPQALTAWYRDHLGVGAGCGPAGDSPDDWAWRVAAGPVVFQPFAADTDYFAADHQWMLNLRVEGLDALLQRLRAAGIAIITRDDWDTPETGRFARIRDPEGNPIELWEPPAGA